MNTFTNCRVIEKSEITVGLREHIEKCDYYCDGENDQKIVDKAIEYAEAMDIPKVTIKGTIEKLNLFWIDRWLDGKLTDDELKRNIREE